MGDLSGNCDSGIVSAWDATILEGLDLSTYGVQFKDDFKLTNPQEGIVIRPLSTADYDKGFTEVLEQLTRVGKVSKAMFMERFYAMKAAGGYYTVVVEDTQADNDRGKIVGAGTLEIEQKFIHECALRGRVEEIVIDSEYRGRKFGKIVLGLITELGKKLGCYKVTLECKDENVNFYKIFGFNEDPQKFMQLRIRD